MLPPKPTIEVLGYALTIDGKGLLYALLYIYDGGHLHESEDESLDLLEEEVCLLDGSVLDGDDVSLVDLPDGCNPLMMLAIL